MNTPEGAVSVVKARADLRATEETGKDRPAAPIFSLTALRALRKHMETHALPVEEFALVSECYARELCAARGIPFEPRDGKILVDDVMVHIL